MSTINVKVKAPTVYTHGGAKADRATPYGELKRSVCSCLLWEDTFYEDGQRIADRIKKGVQAVSVSEILGLIKFARNELGLRSVSAYLASLLVQKLNVPEYNNTRRALVTEAFMAAVRRPDDLTEIVALYWRDNRDAKGNRKQLTNAMRHACHAVFAKLSDYQLAKYSKRGAVRLRDVLRMSHYHPPVNRLALFKSLNDDTIKVPDTWEVAISATQDKKAEWTRLLVEGKLGPLALLRNLRNLVNAGVEIKLIAKALDLIDDKGLVFPYQYYSAYREADSRLAPHIDAAMLRSLQQAPKLPGTTLWVVDISGSMRSCMSGRSKMNRMEAACSLTAIGAELCEFSKVYATAGSDSRKVHATKEVPYGRGITLINNINSMYHQLGGGGIFLTQAMNFLEPKVGDVDRVVVVTDEQDCSGRLDPPSKAPLLGSRGNYIVNVGSYKNGIGREKWTKIDGFSTNVLKFIAAEEGLAFTQEDEDGED